MLTKRHAGMEELEGSHFMENYLALFTRSGLFWQYHAQPMCFLSWILGVGIMEDLCNPTDVRFLEGKNLEMLYYIKNSMQARNKRKLIAQVLLNVLNDQGHVLSRHWVEDSHSAENTKVGCHFVWTPDDESMNEWLQGAVSQPNYIDLKLLKGCDLSIGPILEVLKGGLRQYLSWISENPQMTDLKEEEAYWIINERMDLASLDQRINMVNHFTELLFPKENEGSSKEWKTTKSGSATRVMVFGQSYFLNNLRLAMMKERASAQMCICNYEGSAMETPVGQQSLSDGRDYTLVEYYGRATEAQEAQSSPLDGNGHTLVDYKGTRHWRSMALDTLRSDEAHRVYDKGRKSILQPCSLTTEGIELAQPAPVYRFLNRGPYKVSSLSKTWDDLNRPCPWIPTHVHRTFHNLTTDDIKGACPNPKNMKLGNAARGTNPLDPAYSLPSCKVSPPLEPKFLRDKPVSRLLAPYLPTPLFPTPKSPPLSNPWLLLFAIPSFREFPEACGDLTLLLNHFAFHCKFVYSSVSKAGLAKLIGLVGETTVQAEEQKKLDVLLNDVFIKATVRNGRMNILVSEDLDEAHFVEKSLCGKDLTGCSLAWQQYDSSKILQTGSSCTLVLSTGSDVNGFTLY
ncbi:hypothetical protein L7F22_016255 [Adiantum nelumboides]|nr:hypothetical protein [Adiantum nelumboides]